MGTKKVGAQRERASTQGRGPGGSIVVHATTRGIGKLHHVQAVQGDWRTEFRLRPEKISDFGTVTISFICDKYYPIMD